jgi:pimeloyl-ACP methyl ester carboxylesterase/putative sterol carrier protein
MHGSVGHGGLLADVQGAFRSLPERYLGAPEGRSGTVQIRLADIGRVYQVRCGPHSAQVLAGVSTRPDVVIATDAATWLALRDGRLSSVAAFYERRLTARGDLDAAIAFEGMFRLPNGRPPLVRLRDVRLPGRRTISTLSLGEGPDVVLIHGLGATKTSFFDTAATLAANGYRVHAIDLPGFGSSSKPLGAPYNASWFADSVLALLDALDIDRAHIVGNSMGGRVAIEVALRAPRRVGGLALLSPAVAFVKRPWLRVVQALPPQLGVLPHAFTRGMVSGQLRAMFADPDAIDPATADIAVDEFRRIYASPHARAAFLTAARNIYLERPFGTGGFYERLSTLRAPAMFVWGTHDPLIPSAFSHHVSEWLPDAEQIVLDQCGHVPQIERSAQTNGLVTRFLHRADLSVGGEVGRAAA